MNKKPPSTQTMVKTEVFMKKIILSSICGLLALTSLTMVGCGNSAQDAAVKNLSKQLDRATNTVSSMTTTQFAELSPTSYMTNQGQYSENYKQYRPLNRVGYRSNDYVASQISKMEASTYEQENLKQNILNQTAMLKNYLGKDLKLNKNQIKALNNLTNTMCKYTTSLNSTKTDINSSIKNIKKNNGVKNYNAEQTGSYYQSLNNHLDARLCYFRNLINTMDQIESILNCENCNDSQNNQTPNNEVYYQQQGDAVSRKNVDTYVTPNNEIAPISQNGNYNNGYNVNYNNGYYNNGYNNGYNYNNGYVRNEAFNPNRNTDTYAPRIRNIDTYRINPNSVNYNNINNNVTVPANTTVDNNETQQQEDSTKQESTIVKSSIERKTHTTEKQPVKTQEVRHFTPAKSGQPSNKTLNMFDIDHTQTNKKIERLIKG